MDWGAWWATVQRVAKSRRGLSSYAYTHLIILHSLSFYRIVVHIIIVNIINTPKQRGTVVPIDGEHPMVWANVQ